MPSLESGGHAFEWISSEVLGQGPRLPAAAIAIRLRSLFLVHSAKRVVAVVVACWHGFRSVEVRVQRARARARAVHPLDERIGLIR